ncbi:potassium/sodium hyperpolarization-activated cyclic nucleotide-gated channel 1 [Folsomia candida]|uniref:potassium/sodium hyperpolarization-activated cyclic nucleotide-gated channel 1 n=1 Tax=Folsomia candida TaxID=158441 RepID=UPI001604BAE0|nr:potassium/sodium hyperpolarization-activated cyclic nucleotide-gated channel 1 [Folsomia candida]
MYTESCVHPTPCKKSSCSTTSNRKSDFDVKMGSSRFQNLFLISLNSRVNGSGIMRNVMAVQRERRRQWVAFPATIHPYSNFRWYWDIFITIILLLALVANPIQIAFYSTNEEDNLGVVIASLIAAIIFFLDISFNFRTGFEDQHSDLVILDRSEIARTYLRSWFLIDVFSSIPFDAIYYIISNATVLGTHHHFYYKVIRLLGLLKVFRLFRVIQCLQRIEKAFQIPELRIRLINLLVMIFTILHWLACWHWLVADLCNPPGYRKEFSWITRTKLWDKPNWIRYINAALRALSNMGCLGYGGFAGEAPAEPEDIIATLISIMIGATCFALYIGTMGSIVQSVNASEKKFGEVMLEVNEYMKFRNIPKNVQHRVKTYYEQRYRRNYFDEGMILGSVSDVLRNEMQMHNCHHLVEKVSLFKSLPMSFLTRIVANLKFEVYLPNDVIIEAGNEGQAMYFIQEGEVNILSNDQHVSTLSSGDYFGEVALVSDNCKTTATVVAKDYCDMYRLERSDFFAVFEGHSEVLAQIKKVAQRRNEDTQRKTSTVTKSCLELVIE